MNRRIPEPVSSKEEAIPSPAWNSEQELPREGYRYSSNHWWTRKTDSGFIRVGIGADLAAALPAIKSVVFPSLRQRLVRGQTCVWIVMEGGTLPLEAPMEGVVRAVNHDLIEKPHLLSRQPFTDGWLCELQVDDADVETAVLMTADEARPRYATDRGRFLSSLARIMRGKRSAVGVTIADGGERQQHLWDMLGPSRYFTMLRQTFGWNRK